VEPGGAPESEDFRCVHSGVDISAPENVAEIKIATHIRHDHADTIVSLFRDLVDFRTVFEQFSNSFEQFRTVSFSLYK